MASVPAIIFIRREKPDHYAPAKNNKIQLYNERLRRNNPAHVAVRPDEK
jgi:hypothetical protein